MQTLNIFNWYAAMKARRPPAPQLCVLQGPKHDTIHKQITATAYSRCYIIQLLKQTQQKILLHRTYYDRIPQSLCVHYIIP